MSDELPKKVFSVPPPPTDEIDSEWGGKGADESGKTATQAADDGEAPASNALPPSETAAAPSTHPPALEEEEDDEDDDEDDEDEDDRVQRVAHASHAPVTGSARAAVNDDDWLPNWAPWAILALLIVVGVAGGLGAFTKPPAEAASEATPSAEGNSAAVPTSVEASHFLVQYKGSMRAPESITRTKEEAKKRAEEGLAKARKGADFAKIVGEYSDEPGAASRGGALGEFQANQMVKPFSDAAFKLKVGQISGLVETDFGFHVIKRTK